MWKNSFLLSCFFLSLLQIYRSNETHLRRPTLPLPFPTLFRFYFIYCCQKVEIKGGIRGEREKIAVLEFEDVIQKSWAPNFWDGSPQSSSTDPTRGLDCYSQPPGPSHWESRQTELITSIALTSPLPQHTPPPGWLLPLSLPSFPDLSPLPVSLPALSGARTRAWIILQLRPTHYCRPFNKTGRSGGVGGWAL